MSGDKGKGASRWKGLFKTLKKNNQKKSVMISTPFALKHETHVAFNRESNSFVVCELNPLCLPFLSISFLYHVRGGYTSIPSLSLLFGMLALFMPQYLPLLY